MDNLTHTLTGVCLSRAGLNRLTPLATPILIVAANIPDADIVSLMGGSANYLHWHRNVTHSILFAPALALLIALAFRRFRPSLNLTRVFLVALCGIASHLLEDLTNIYGVRLLSPFRGDWFDWDLTPVIDFWIWAALGMAMAAPFLAGLVGSEIGERRGKSPGGGFAITALMFLVLYNGGRALIRSHIVQTLNTREYDGAPPLRVAAFPGSMNPLDWRGIVETPSRYQRFALRVPGLFDPLSPEEIAKAVPSSAIDSASQTAAFRTMAEFAQYPLYRIIPGPEGGSMVELSDLRFSFTSTAMVNQSGIVTRSVFQFGPVAPR